MNARDKLLQLVRGAGWDPRVMADPHSAHVMADGHTLLSSHTVPGVTLESAASTDGIEAEIRVAAGQHIVKPVHLCFGLLHPSGEQRIKMRLILEPDSRARVLSHCLFTPVRHGAHWMDGRVEIGAGAHLDYVEGHYHGLSGGMRVTPTVAIQVGEGARFRSDFSLLHGNVGELAVDLRVRAAARSITEILSRVFGHADDRIRIAEQIALDGEGARGLIKARVVLEQRARAEIFSLTEGNAAGTRGHMDCMEIIKDQALGEATPVVKVTHPQAKITHEAAIGTVDKAQLEALMARGLAPEEAVDLIVKGILAEFPPAG